MTPLGDQLRAERERRGEVLEQVSDATRIRTLYLEALERRDWAALPADVFTRGYVRTYAQYLGLDQEHLLKAYARERRIAGVDGPSASGQDERDARAFLERLAKTQGVEAQRFGTRRKWLALGLGGVGAGAVALWTILHLLGPAAGASRAIDGPSRRGALPRQGGVSHSPAVAPTVAPAIAPAAALPPLPQSEPSASHLQVPEFGVGTDVVGHRLVGRGDRFREGTSVWFWTSVLGGRPGDRIRHVWLHEGRSVAVAELDVKGAQWRTQSHRSLPEGSTGDWTVEARDPDGRVIATVGFACVARE